MFRCYGFQPAVSNRVFFNAADSAKVIFHCTVAECANFEFFLSPNVKQSSKRDIVSFCNEFLAFVVLHCLP